MNKLTENWCLEGTNQFMGDNFGWLAVRFLSPDWLSRELKVSDFFRRLDEAQRLGGGGAVRAVPRLCILYPGICLTTEETHGKPQSD
jgi:hypothetical protein